MDDGGYTEIMGWLIALALFLFICGVCSFQPMPHTVPVVAQCFVVILTYRAAATAWPKRLAK